MDLDFTKQYLTSAQFDRLAAAVAKLEAGIAAGAVRNVDLTEAKFTINRRIEEIVETRKEYGSRHVGGVSALNPAIKEAKNNFGRHALLTSLLPFRDLLEAAKPLVVKRGQGPKVPTKRELERSAHTMTCQCCERQIYANTGTIAHHGYERPGHGWQTSSCFGAKRLPFEVDRAALGEMIVFLRHRLKDQRAHRKAIADEMQPIVFGYAVQFIGPVRYYNFAAPSWSREKWPTVQLWFDVTRESFDEFKAGVGSGSTYGDDYEDYKAKHVAHLDRQIADLVKHIAYEQGRFDGWKQTHERCGDEWINLAPAIANGAK